MNPTHFIIAPPGVDLEANIRLASQRYSPLWLYSQVRRTGPWDFRLRGEEFRAFGNYHYGAVAKAMGFPTWLILRLAGAEHWWSGRSRKEWGRPWGPWPHGDDPQDSADIAWGIERAAGYGPLTSRIAWRVLDILVASVMLLCFGPLLALLAAAVVLTSGRPAFDGSLRLGRYGRPFRCWKLRTLRVNHAEILTAHLAAHPGDWEQWERYAKLPNDPRATRIGRWLRKTSLDDLLPQAWNILRGEMAVFGPRAFLVTEDLGDYRDAILSVTPGWVSYYGAFGRASMPFNTRLKYEADFAVEMREWSAKWRALKGTIRHCLWGTGA